MYDVTSCLVRCSFRGEGSAQPLWYLQLVATTAVVGTHPTGMHSCCTCNGFEIRDYFWEKLMGEDDILYTNHLAGK